MAITPTVTKSTVFGDMRVVFGTIAATTTADEFDTGLDYVFHCSLQNRGETLTTNDVRCVINSNDGTAGTSNGEVFVDVQANATLEFMAIGK